MSYLNIFVHQLVALLKDDALLASTSAFTPLIIIPPIAATPLIIANAGIALLLLIFSLDVTGPCIVVLNLLGKSASNVKFILHSSLFLNVVIMSISQKQSILKLLQII